jgi:hypothetical protein
MLDSLTPIGALAVTPNEVPSLSLSVKIAPGAYNKQDGSVVIYQGASLQTIQASSTSYVYLDLTLAGNLVINTTGWPASTHVRLATVLAGPSTILEVTDQRIVLSATGSILDGTNYSFGTNIGTQFGTTVHQKIAFYGQAPVAQPTMGSATAGVSYSVNEQSMLQTVYNTLRTLGLGS